MHNTRPARRRARRNAARELVDRTGAAVLPGFGRDARAGGRSSSAGPDIDLPMYAPHESGAHPEGAELVGALRDADAVVVGSPGYHGAVSGLVKNALDYIEDLREDPRVYLDNTPWGCISCAYGWQAAVGTLGQLRVHRACAARLADPARGSDQLGGSGLGLLG